MKTLVDRLLFVHPKPVKIQMPTAQEKSDSAFDRHGITPTLSNAFQRLKIRVAAKLVLVVRLDACTEFRFRRDVHENFISDSPDRLNDRPVNALCQPSRTKAANTVYTSTRW